MAFLIYSFVHNQHNTYLVQLILHRVICCIILQYEQPYFFIKGSTFNKKCCIVPSSFYLHQSSVPQLKFVSLKCKHNSRKKGEGCSYIRLFSRYDTIKTKVVNPRNDEQFLIIYAECLEKYCIVYETNRYEFHIFNLVIHIEFYTLI